MRVAPLAFALSALIATLGPSVALASNPVGGCTMLTHASACNHDGSSPCSGVCLPDFSETGVPTMLCFPADTAFSEGSGNPMPRFMGVEGFACSPTGPVAADCGHSCRAGECVATNATAGMECDVPDGGANVCTGACDGMGACAAAEHGLVTIGEDYGYAPGGCTFVACNPIANANPMMDPQHGEFTAPAGTPCNPYDICETNAVCDDGGGCLGTPIPGCVAPTPDAGAGPDEVDSAAPAADAGTRHDAGARGADASASSTASKVGGCSMHGVGAGGAAPSFSFAALLAVLGLGRRSRRRR
jgi:MYXO-CTERM domain-containing protein